MVWLQLLSPSVGRGAGAFGDSSEALSSRRECETEHEGRQHSPRVIFWSRAERGLDTLRPWPKGPHPNPLPAILGSSRGRESKPQAGDGLPAGMMLAWERRR
jgi:hypothetical protein